MLWTVVVILLVLWAIGFGTGVGNLIHLLLVVAVVVAIVRLVQGGTAV